MEQGAGGRIRTRPITSALDAVLVLGPEQTVLEFSPAAEHLFGIDRTAALGRDLVELIVPVELQGDVRAALGGGEEEASAEGGELLGRRETELTLLAMVAE